MNLNFLLNLSKLFPTSMLLDTIATHLTLVAITEIVPTALSTIKDLSVNRTVDLIILIELTCFISATLLHSLKKQHHSEGLAFETIADNTPNTDNSNNSAPLTLASTLTYSMSLDLLRFEEDKSSDIALSNINQNAIDAKLFSSVSTHISPQDPASLINKVSSPFVFPHSFAECLADVSNDTSKYVIEYIEVLDDFSDEDFDEYHDDYEEEYEYMEAEKKKVPDKRNVEEMPLVPLIHEDQTMAQVSHTFFPHSFADVSNDSSKYAIEYIELVHNDFMDEDPDNYGGNGEEKDFMEEETTKEKDTDNNDSGDILLERKGSSLSNCSTECLNDSEYIAKFTVKSNDCDFVQDFDLFKKDDFNPDFESRVGTRAPVKISGSTKEAEGLPVNICYVEIRSLFESIDFEEFRRARRIVVGKGSES